MDKEKRDKLWGDLKIVVATKLEECEKETGVKIGRDELERQEHISRAAGMMYGHLIKEVKGIVGQFVGNALRRIDKLS